MCFEECIIRALEREKGDEHTFFSIGLENTRLLMSKWSSKDNLTYIPSSYSITFIHFLKIHLDDINERLANVNLKYLKKETKTICSLTRLINMPSTYWKS